jgi:UDP-N-acetylmuramoyl-tripeptide--D-alanyl-D-alanine ligase
MAELGDYAAGAHRAIGRLAAQRGVDLVIAVGTHASLIEEGARDAGCRHVWTYRDVSELLRELPRLVRAGDAVLVKGSRRLHLEQVSEWVQAQFGAAPRAGASAAACPAS